MKIDLEKCIHCNKAATHGGMFCDDHRLVAIEKTLKRAKERFGDKIKTCGILYTRNEFKDHDGCIKPDAHNDHHVCRLEDGTLMAWEDDYDCKCGCWDEYESGDSEVCRVYKKVNSVDDKF